MRNLSHIAGRLYNAPLLIESGKLETIEHVFREHIHKRVDAFDDDEDVAAGSITPKPYAVEDDGIAVIRILGTTVRRATGLRAMSGMTSYTKLSSDIAAAVKDPDVKAIMLDIDSGGGEAGGCFDLSDQIYESRGAKPIWSCSNESMFSAAYANGSAAERVYLSRTAGVGSIGVVSMHTDQSKAIEDAGIKVKFIKFGARKVDGNSAEPLSDRAEESMQAEVNRIGEMFVATVARNRGISVQAVRDTEAALFFGESAIEAGLADQLGTFAEAMNDLRALIGAETETQPENEDAAGGPLETDDDDREMLPLAKSGAIVFPNGMDVHAAKRVGAAHGWAKYDKATLGVRSFGASLLSGNGSQQRITGCPVPYNVLSGDMGGFREMYAPGCFTESLASDDVRVLFDHNTSMVIGRKSASTADFTETATGVDVSAAVPDTTWARDLTVSMRRGDITQMSASFYILKQRWETRASERVRVIEKARMVEVSVHSIPAYGATTARANDPAPTQQAQHQNGHIRARLELLKLA